MSQPRPSQDLKLVLILFISSRLMKEIVHLGGSVSAFVPESVEQRMKDKIAK